MTLQDLGYNDELEQHRQESGLGSLDVGRVTAEHKERYVVRTAEKEYDGEILGNLRYAAQSRSDFPAVGDWVAISEYDEDKVLIHAIFPRKSLIERQAVGRKGDKQVIAANIDTAFIVQAVDRDFSINRIERYLTICYEAKVEPVIVLSKVDLISTEELDTMLDSIRAREQGVPVFAVSNESRQGIEALEAGMEKGRTYCLLGSSGVGKSTLLNTIAGKEMMKTRAISAHTVRGKHMTTHRELVILDNGSILIDNPGMREVGMTDVSSGLEMTFESIADLARECKFKDCSHNTETGCSVLAALEDGTLDPDTYENYLKMVREKDHFESTLADRRKKDKAFGKMIKHAKKQNFGKF